MLPEGESSLKINTGFEFSIHVPLSALSVVPRALHPHLNTSVAMFRSRMFDHGKNNIKDVEWMSNGEKFYRFSCVIMSISLYTSRQVMKTSRRQTVGMILKEFNFTLQARGSCCQGDHIGMSLVGIFALFRNVSVEKEGRERIECFLQCVLL